MPISLRWYATMPEPRTVSSLIVISSSVSQLLIVCGVAAITADTSSELVSDMRHRSLSSVSGDLDPQCHHSVCRRIRMNEFGSRISRSSVAVAAALFVVVGLVVVLTRPVAAATVS